MGGKAAGGDLAWRIYRGRHYRSKGTKQRVLAAGRQHFRQRTFLVGIAPLALPWIRKV